MKSRGAVVFLLVLSCCAYSFGEDEYKFGMALAERGFVKLSTEYFEMLQSDTSAGPRARLEGTLGLASLKMLTAKAEYDLEKRKELYDEAERLFKKFLDRSPARSPGRAVAEGELANLTVLRAEAVAAAARTERDPKKRDLLVTEAARLFGEVVERRRKVADEAWEKFKKFHVDFEQVSKEVAAKMKPEHARLAQAAAESSQKYLLDAIKFVEIYPREDKRRKEQASGLVARAEEEVEHWENMGDEYTGVVLWFRFALGMSYGALGEYDKADESFKEITAIDHSDYHGGAREWLVGLKAQTLYNQARIALDLGLNDKAVAAVDSFRFGLREKLKEPIGKATLLIKVDALSAGGDYSGAIETALVVAKGDAPWKYNAVRAMATSYLQAEKQGKTVEGDARAFYYIGMGLYQLSRMPQNAAGRDELIESSIDSYGHAVRLARRPEVSYTQRLRVEPEAWYGMGMAYHHLGLRYESALAFEAVIRNFSPHIVGREFARMSAYRKALREIRDKIKSGEIKPREGREEVNPYEELYDKIREEKPYLGVTQETVIVDGKEKVKDAGLPVILKKCANNYGFALRLQKAQTRHTFDSELELQATILMIRFDPSQQAKLDLVKGEVLDTQAAGALSRGKKKKAVELYTRAAEAYGNIGKDSKAHESALWKAGRAYYKGAYELSRVLKGNPRVVELADKALEQFNKYERFVVAHPNVDEKKKRKRRTTGANVLMFKSFALFVAGKNEEGVAAADRYLGSKDRDESFVSSVLWKKFKAFGSLAAKSAIAAVMHPKEYEAHVQAAHEYLVSMGKVADEIKGTAGAERYYGTACSYVSGAWSKHGKNLENVARQLPGEARAALKPALAEAKKESADWMERLLDDPKKAKDPAFIAGVAGIFYKLGSYEDAQRNYEKVLELLDPDGDNKVEELETDEEVWRAEKKKIFRDDMTEQREIKDLHDRIRDLIYDEPGAKQKPADERGEKLIDYDKAYDLVVSVIGDGTDENPGKWPEIQTLEFLEKLKTELFKRVLILKARRSIADCYARLARDAVDGGRTEEATSLLTQARDNYEKLLDYFFGNSAILCDLAEVNASLGRISGDKEAFNKALKGFRKARLLVPKDSEREYRIAIRYSRVAFEAGAYKVAKQFPSTLLQLDPDSAALYFADAEQFISECNKKLEEMGIAAVTEVTDRRQGVSAAKALSGADQKLKAALHAIEMRIKLNKLSEGDRAESEKAAIEMHLRIEMSKKLKTARGLLKAGKVSEAEFNRDMYSVLRKWIYVHTIEHQPFLDKAWERGVIPEGEKACPLEYLGEDVVEMARQIGLLDEDGNKLPEPPPSKYPGAQESEEK